MVNKPLIRPYFWGGGYGWPAINGKKSSHTFGSHAKHTKNKVKDFIYDSGGQKLRSFVDFGGLSLDIGGNSTLFVFWYLKIFFNERTLIWTKNHPQLKNGEKKHPKKTSCFCKPLLLITESVFPSPGQIICSSHHGGVWHTHTHTHTLITDHKPKQ